MNIFFPETCAFFALLWLTGIEINVNSFWLLAQILCNYAKCKKKMTNSKKKKNKRPEKTLFVSYVQPLAKDVSQKPLIVS